MLFLFSFIFLLLVSGVLVQGAIFVFFSSLNLWFIKAGTLFSLLFNNTWKFAGYPLGIFPPLIRNQLVFAVLFAFVNNFPARYFLHKESGDAWPSGMVLLTPLLAVLLFSAAYAFWRASVRRNSSAGN